MVECLLQCTTAEYVSIWGPFKRKWETQQEERSPLGRTKQKLSKKLPKVISPEIPLRFPGKHRQLILKPGGFSYVFLVKDVSSGKTFALKRMLVNDEAALKNIQNEIDIMVGHRWHSSISNSLIEGTSCSQKYCTIYRSRCDKSGIEARDSKRCRRSVYFDGALYR